MGGGIPIRRSSVEIIYSCIVGCIKHATDRQTDTDTQLILQLNLFFKTCSTIPSLTQYCFTFFTATQSSVGCTRGSSRKKYLGVEGWPLIIWEATTAKRNYYRINYINHQQNYCVQLSSIKQLIYRNYVLHRPTMYYFTFM